MKQEKLHESIITHMQIILKLKEADLSCGKPCYCNKFSPSIGITQFILPAASATAAPIMAPMALSAKVEAICSYFRQNNSINRK